MEARPRTFYESWPSSPSPTGPTDRIWWTDIRASNTRPRLEADIILCAWGQAFISDEESEILQEAREKGVVLVSSAGNFPERREQYPAGHDTVMAVAALDPEDRKIERSNHGAFVDLSAPGAPISSTSSRSDTDFEEREGTSQAAALVAAAAALVKQSHPSYSPAQVTACLKQSSRNIESLNPRFIAQLGAGKLNVAGAVVCDLFGEEARGTGDAAESSGVRAPHGCKSRITHLVHPATRCL